MGLTRRHFIAQSAALCALYAAPLSGHAAARRRAPLLVVITLRGGADGLHLVAPLGDPNYQSARGALALESGIAFEKGFVFHPVLGGLKGWLDEKRLAVVHAAGFPDPSRSHFEAQDSMEWGISGGDPRPLRGEGWLARALRLAQAPAHAKGLDALAIAPSLPLALRGSASLAIQHPAQLGLAHADRAALQRLALQYKRSDDPASRAALRALEISEKFRDDVPSFSRRTKRPSLKASVAHLREMGRLGLTPSVVCLESDGWDTHQGQGREQGRFARTARDLGDAMAGLFALQSEREIRVVVMSEFGRTVRANGSGGSDHGHGGVLWVAGRDVHGGLYGVWPGLHRDRLYEGRDLSIVNDTRHVLHETLGVHLQAPVVPSLFPGFAPIPFGIFG